MRSLHAPIRENLSHGKSGTHHRWNRFVGNHGLSLLDVDSSGTLLRGDPMQSLATVSLAVSGITTASHQSGRHLAPQLDVLMLFGFFAGILTLLFWMHRRQSRSAVMGLAVCLAAMAVYGFLEGAWPLGIVVSVLSASAFCRWHNEKYVGRAVSGNRRIRAVALPGRWDMESRISRVRSEWN